MKNLTVNPADFEAEVEYPIAEAPEWGTELRGPVKFFYENRRWSHDWIVNCSRPERDIYIARPDSLSEDDMKALFELQKQNNWNGIISFQNPHATSEEFHGNWVSVESEDDKLKIIIRFVPMWKREV